MKNFLQTIALFLSSFTILYILTAEGLKYLGHDSVPLVINIVFITSITITTLHLIGLLDTNE